MKTEPEWFAVILISRREIFRAWQQWIFWWCCEWYVKNGFCCVMEWNLLCLSLPSCPVLRYFC